MNDCLVDRHMNVHLGPGATVSMQSLMLCFPDPEEPQEEPQPAPYIHISMKRRSLLQNAHNAIIIVNNFP